MGPAHTQLSFRHPALRPKAKEKPSHCWKLWQGIGAICSRAQLPSTHAVVDSWESRATPRGSPDFGSAVRLFLTTPACGVVLKQEADLPVELQRAR
jgi:hypothetical protein